MKLLLLNITLLSLLLSSCSSSKQKGSLDINDQDVVTKFDLSKDLLEKFSHKKNSTKSTKAPKGKKNKSKSKSKSKHKFKRSSKKKILKKSSKKSLENKSEQRQGPSASDPKKLDPRDHTEYPKKFIALDKVSKGIWEHYKENIYINESAVYKMKYLGVTAGYITLNTEPLTQINGEESYHFKALVKTASYYSMIYWLNDTLNSYVVRDGFLPVKYVLSQREKKQDIDDLQLFDREKLKTFFLYRKLKNGQTHKKNEVKSIPYYFQDSFSSIYFLRGLALNIGTSVEYPIVNKAKYWILKMKVVAIETIDIMGRDVKAFKIAAETKFPGALKKSGDIFFWFATDSSRRLLKFEGKVKIGSIHGELVKFRPGTKIR